MKETRQNTYTTDKVAKIKRISKAFTLIELLIVVAIISVLAAILFPVFARARENARRVSCLSNLKQIGLGVMMYVQDYDEKYPRVQPVIDGVTKRWMHAVDPYTKNVQVFLCPSRGSAASTAFPDNGNYGANTRVMPWRATTPEVSMATIGSPATIYLVMDAGEYQIDDAMAQSHNRGRYLPGSGDVAGFNSGECPMDDSGNQYYQNNFGSDCMSGRHFGGVNMAFADGHVKWLSTQIVYKEALNGTSGQWHIH